MRERAWNIEYEYDRSAKKLVNVYWSDAEITPVLWKYLHPSGITITEAFNRLSKKIELNPMVERICNDIFQAIEEIKIKQGDEHLAFLLSNYLFERFTNYWILDLLDDGKDIVGVLLWQKILDVVKKWEDSNTKGIKIHKGIPYYFLAENYLLIGDRDLAFVYLFNALREDRDLDNTVASQVKYPEKSPAFLTATMKDDNHNHMYLLITELRDLLNDYVSTFKKDYHPNFLLQDIDTKFLQNSIILDIVIFFVSNFLYINDMRKMTKSSYLQNDFSKLRSLDLFFNLALIIDEVLKEAYKKHKGKLEKNHSIRHSILWLCDHSGWMKQSDLEDLWGQNNLNLNADDPDLTIPILISKSMQHKGNKICKEVFVLLVAYTFRNYAGHNIKQQVIVVNNYDDIISHLIFALFLSIEKL